MTAPNLAGVIVKDDVFQKGSGNYAASYVSWARVANYLHTKAPGWEFHLRPNVDGDLIWKAPDGTGYVVSYFTGPDGVTTANFPFPCQDNRNQPIAYDKVSCRTLTDTHRRALCANAAFTFSLGYELWAKEEVEDSVREETIEPTSTTAKQSAPKQAAKQPVTKSTSSGPQGTREQFFEAALEKGLTTHAAEALAAKLKGNYAGGIDRLNEKDSAWVTQFNESCAPKETVATDGSQW